MAAVVPIQVKVEGAEQVKSTLGSIGKALVAAFAVDKIKDFVQLGLKEWSQAQTASNSLTAALGKQSDALLNLANSTAKQSKFKSEELTGGYARLAMYGLTEKQILKLAPAYDDLAATTGDTETAAKLLGQAISTGTGRLSQYGVVVDKTASVDERLNSVIAQSENAFGGQAKAAFDAMNPMEKMNRLWEDSAAAVGEALIPTLNELYDSMPDLTEVLSNVTKGIITVFKFAQIGLNMLIIGVVGAMDGFITLLTKIPGHPKFLDSWKESLDTFTETAINNAGTIADSIDKVWAKQENKPTTRNKKVLGDTGADKEAEKLEKERQAAILRIQQETDQLYMNENEKKMYELGVQYAKDLEMFKDNEAEKAKISILYEAEMIKVVSAEEKRVRKEKKDTLDKIVAYDLKEMASLGDKALQEQVLANRRAEQKKRDEQQAITATASQLGQMAQLLEGHKEFIALYKTMAIAQATMDTYASAVSAYNSAVKTPIVGPVLGPIAAGIAVAFGLQNVAQISAQKFAYGGEVTGGVPGVDSVPAMLSPGELVYNPNLPDPRIAQQIGGGDQFHIGGTQIHINGNVSRSTVAEIGKVTERALITAMRKAQSLGKITATGMKIRN